MGISYLTIIIPRIWIDSHEQVVRDFVPPLNYTIKVCVVAVSNFVGGGARLQVNNGAPEGLSGKRQHQSPDEGLHIAQ